jgi:hypothetical protein
MDGAGSKDAFHQKNSLLARHQGFLQAAKILWSTADTTFFIGKFQKAIIYELEEKILRVLPANLQKSNVGYLM